MCNAEALDLAWYLLPSFYISISSKGETRVYLRTTKEVVLQVVESREER
jgi:hypothetical protein